MNTSFENAQTRHAAIRLAQRGISKELFDLHEEYADNECFIGGGCMSRTLSDEATLEMKFAGVSCQKAEKTRKLAILYSPDNEVITALVVFKGSGKRYRNGARKRYRTH
jgi:hypothetical protein